jgi:succinate-semialdehyde dehydrogenase/glutarate-semialdehyde dehydrogenase
VGAGSAAPAVGRLLAERSGRQLLRSSWSATPLSLVFDDSDPEAALDGAMISKLRNGGETCTTANRLLVHEAAAETFDAGSPD